MFAPPPSSFSPSSLSSQINERFVDTGQDAEHHLLWTVSQPRYCRQTRWMERLFYFTHKENSKLPPLPHFSSLQSHSLVWGILCGVFFPFSQTGLMVIFASTAEIVKHKKKQRKIFAECVREFVCVCVCVMWRHSGRQLWQRCCRDQKFLFGYIFPCGERKKKKAKVQLQARHVWALQGG